jgi:hypothetical protein
MSIVIRSRESWLPAVLRPHFRGHTGIREWISEEHWTPQPGMTKRRLQGTVHSVDTFAEACIRDAVRLAIASFESAAAVEAAAADGRSCAWQFIKYYYSAFFAANALMRLSGQASMNLTAADCAAINSWAFAHAVGGRDEKNRLVAGLYQMQLNASKTPTFDLRLSGGKGGVHIQFWVGFASYLNVLRADVSKSPAPTAEKQAALDDIALLESHLQQGGLTQGSWLSEMRNAVNYRFEHGVWFPYQTPNVDADMLRTSFRVHALKAGRFSGGHAADPEVVRAARACGYLVGWLRTSMEMIGAYSKGEKGSLISKGALTFAAAM